MQFDYNGYTLNVEEVDGNYRVSCEGLYPFSVDYSIEYWKSNLEIIINNFKQKVDSKTK